MTLKTCVNLIEIHILIRLHILWLCKISSCLSPTACGSAFCSQISPWTSLEASFVCNHLGVIINPLAWATCKRPFSHLPSPSQPLHGVYLKIKMWKQQAGRTKISFFFFGWNCRKMKELQYAAATYSLRTLDFRLLVAFWSCSQKRGSATLPVDSSAQLSSLASPAPVVDVFCEL